MNTDETYILKSKCIITISIALLILSIGLYLTRNINLNKTEYTFSLKQVNIKNISPVAVAMKTGAKSTPKIVSANDFPKKNIVASQQPTVQNTPQQQSIVKPTPVSNKPVWRLPTDRGYITQYPSYNHNSLDITSARGTYEGIYPVADGTIARIYYDNAGALTVMINHNINGQQYLSQYVHLSSFAPGIYEGKYVTTDDRIGQMGATGIATGVHLHLAVMPCNYGSGNCTSIGHFSNFAKYSYNNGFIGLQDLMYVPHSWTSR